MRISIRSALALAGMATLLAACADTPYGYDDGYRYGYRGDPYRNYDRGYEEHHWRDRDEEHHWRDRDD